MYVYESILQLDRLLTNDITPHLLKGTKADAFIGPLFTDPGTKIAYVLCIWSVTCP